MCRAAGPWPLQSAAESTEVGRAPGKVYEVEDPEAA